MLSLDFYFVSNVGILAGMRPCGVIVLLSELYVSESKSQVYGYLHNYYSLHPATAQSIGMMQSLIISWVH